MANTDGFGLDPTFASTLSQLIDWCQANGMDFRIAQGLRTPQVQAQYYCQWAQRTPAAVNAAVAKLQAAQAPWLAALLASYSNEPRKPAWLTDALPGAGWHQWGLAADCYCYRDGQMVGDGGDPVYKSYADKAQELGLRAGYYFTKRDAGHVQGSQDADATTQYTWAQIDQIMKGRFSGKPVVT